MNRRAFLAWIVETGAAAALAADVFPVIERWAEAAPLAPAPATAEEFGALLTSLYADAMAEAVRVGEEAFLVLFGKVPARAVGEGGRYIEVVHQFAVRP